MNERVISTEEFAKLSAYEKGYAVYSHGDRPEQPNVPLVYSPAVAEAEDYYRGQHAAMLAAQDGEE